MSENTKELTFYKLKVSQRIYRFFKAGMDFVIALTLLILLFLPLVITAIAIKIDSKGPVFFTQKRIGKNGKLFKCIKFRSMKISADHEIAPYEFTEANAYITRVGKFIRKFSIDELPQLFCVLTFKMSLIGYRPSQPCETELNTARGQCNMYQIRPGLSGWAQINGRDFLAAQPIKKAKYDAYYLQKLSFWLDIKIFFLTIVKVFKREDVREGVVEDEQECAEERQEEMPATRVKKITEERGEEKGA